MKMLRLSKVLIHIKMKMLRLSKVLIHLKMKMRRLGKAKDVFIHLQPLYSTPSLTSSESASEPKWLPALQFSAAFEETREELTDSGTQVDRGKLRDGSSATKLVDGRSRTKGRRNPVRPKYGSGFRPMRKFAEK
jgi:hypothetical protein